MERRFDLPQHMPALDGLRAVAIMLVIATHVGDGWRRALIAFQDCDTLPPLDFPRWLRLISDQAGFGVQLFFVVSGFTLAASVLHRSGDWGEYAVRRLARVGPGYWMAGLCYTVASGLGPKLLAPDGISSTDLLVAAVFGGSWQGGGALAVVPGGWSVSCEVAFYCVLPVLLAVTRGHWAALSGVTLLWLCGVQLAIRHYDAIRDWNFITFVYPVLQAPAFLLGVTGAALAGRFRVPDWRVGALAVLVGVIVLFPAVIIPPRWVAGYLVFDVCCAGVVMVCAVHPPRLLAHRVMRHIGMVSYSMYLLHFAVLPVSLWCAERLVPGDGVGTGVLHFVLTFSVTVVLATVSYRVVERPFIAWARTVRARRPAVRSSSPSVP